ncbi:MAG: putative NAD(P)H nitroreductase YdjA [Alphaproteobacteria bacterium MarineAlpha4_Bin2]|nr:MAG: putative NAD(P)H nitroreductase YdjA [Alphaproteobacteria bacterium MarineAlpha4_Bin2]
MDTMQALISRVSVPPRLLSDPAPFGDDLNDIMAAAMSAPDHGALTPWRFITIQGDARAKLGDVFVEALKKRDPEADEAAIEKERNRPMRSPMIVVAVAKIDGSVDNVPAIEQVVATGIAAYNIIVAAQSKGYGGILLTGKNAQDASVKAALGLEDSDEIVSFVYLGTPIKQISDKRRPDAADYISEWTG